MEELTRGAQGGYHHLYQVEVWFEISLNDWGGWVDAVVCLWCGVVTMKLTPSASVGRM